MDEMVTLAWPCAAGEDDADGRRHAVRLIPRSQRAGDRERRRWSRRPAATRSSSRGAARRSTARGDRPRGIPVMGHVGLTPQTSDRARRLQDPGQDRRARRADRRGGMALQAVGCFAIVFEAVPAAVTEEIVERLEVPTIGIGPAWRPRPGARLPRTARDHGGHQRSSSSATPRREAMVAGLPDYAADVRAATSPGPSTSTRSSRRSSRADAVPGPGKPQLCGELGLGAAALENPTRLFRELGRELDSHR